QPRPANGRCPYRRTEYLRYSSAFPRPRRGTLLDASRLSTGGPVILGTWQDLRHGARMLAKNPGFSLIAILSIAIGVGANAAMFSVADGLVLRPLPVPDANALVM